MITLFHFSLQVSIVFSFPWVGGGKLLATSFQNTSLKVPPFPITVFLNNASSIRASSSWTVHWQCMDGCLDFATDWLPSLLPECVNHLESWRLSVFHWTFGGPLLQRQQWRWEKQSGAWRSVSNVSHYTHNSLSCFGMAAQHIYSAFRLSHRWERTPGSKSRFFLKVCLPSGLLVTMWNVTIYGGSSPEGWVEMLSKWYHGAACFSSNYRIR